MVFFYDAREEYNEILFIRDDIESKYDEMELQPHFDTFRRDAHLAEVQESKLQTGSHHCCIRIYDETLIFNFTMGNHYNTMVSLDPEIGRDLLSFVAEAIEQLSSATDGGDWEPPRWV